MSILGFILSDDYFCLSYEKVNYSKIQNSTIKTPISSDRKLSSLLTILINVSCLWLWWALEILTIINQS